MMGNIEVITAMLFFYKASLTGLHYGIFSCIRYYQGKAVLEHGLCFIVNLIAAKSTFCSLFLQNQ